MAKIHRIITRKSKLALAQVEMVIQAIKKVHPDFEYEIIEVLSEGCYERFQGKIEDLGGKGAFVKDLEQAILDNNADFAVHSMKDVPTDQDIPEGLIFPAVLERGDMRDVAVCRAGESFVGLKEGSKVGTSSVRRSAQIKAAFPHLELVPLRGNVPTRIEKVNNGEVDAAILAKAGLDRLGLTDLIAEVFEPDMMLPAVGQGIVGVECRNQDQDLIALLEKVNHQDTFTCITAERAMLQGLGGNCHTPIGGYCEVTKGGNLRMIAHVTSLDGDKLVRAREKMDYNNPQALGEKIAEELIKQGADKLICPPAA